MEEINVSRRPIKSKEPAKEETIKIDPEYFVRVSIARYFAILVGLGMLGLLCFHPFPQDYLRSMGGPGERLQYLRNNYHTEIKIGFFIAILLHIGEALYCIKVATKLNLTQETVNKWAVQTLLLGYTSLYELTKYSDKLQSAKAK